jgi:hypothetical protein
MSTSKQPDPMETQSSPIKGKFMKYILLMPSHIVETDKGS